MALFQSQRERFLGGVTALAVLLGGGYFFVFRPGVEFFESLDQQIVAKKGDLEKKRERYKKSREYRARFDKMRASLSFEGIETEQEKRQQIMEQLNELMERVELVAQGISGPIPERIDDQFRLYEFRLRGINTDWPTLARFLYEVDHSDAVLEVSNMTIKKRTGRAKELDDINVDMDISRLVEHQDERKTSARRGSRLSSRNK
jgi:hypothetical protein